MIDEVVAGAAGQVRLEHAERRRQILAAAGRVFGERHYTLVSSAELAGAAGVSRGLLNHYFGTKRELYLAVVTEMLRASRLRAPAYVEGVTVEQRVAQSFDAWLEMLGRNPKAWLDAIGVGGADSDPELARILDEARDGAVEYIMEVTGLDPAIRGRPEVRAVLRGFSGMAEAVSREWLQRDRLTRGQVQFLLEETLLRIVRETLPAILAEHGEGPGPPAGSC